MGIGGAKRTHDLRALKISAPWVVPQDCRAPCRHRVATPHRIGVSDRRAVHAISQISLSGVCVVRGDSKQYGSDSLSRR
jgi:hypothetical protein